MPVCPWNIAACRWSIRGHHGIMLAALMPPETHDEVDVCCRFSRLSRNPRVCTNDCLLCETDCGRSGQPQLAHQAASASRLTGRGEYHCCCAAVLLLFCYVAVPLASCTPAYVNFSSLSDKSMCISFPIMLLRSTYSHSHVRCEGLISYLRY